MTFVALEGVDGAGKSTLADAIQAELEMRCPGEKIERIHSSQLKQDPTNEYALSFEDYVPGQGVHIIADRLHWGETIYGPLYRGQSALSIEAFRWVELYLKAKGATLWHVSASLETIQDRLRVRGEDYLQSHHVESVWRGFQQCSEASMLTGGTAMTDLHDAETLATYVVDDMMYCEEQAINVYRPEYIGRNFPNALLVGDTRGPGDPDATRAPFIARGSSSGRFLLQSLPDLWWQTVGIVNAHDTDIVQLHDDLMGPPVVALGRKASEKLTELGVEHGAVPHPQFVRRFHARRGTSYGALIRTVSQSGEDKLSWPN